MFIGHLAVGFAAKRFAPKTSLGWLLIATEAPDLLFFCFFVLGWERMRVDPGNTAFTPLAFDHYPYSHSLVTTVLWAATISLLYWAFTRYLAGSLATFVAIASHWFLDAIVHRPDLPLYPGGDSLFGFGLWNSVPGTFLVEGVMFLVGTGLYFSTGKARDRIGKYAALCLIALMLTLFAGSALGPTPASSMVVAISGLALTGVLPAWAAWVDRIASTGSADLSASPAKRPYSNRMREAVTSSRTIRKASLYEQRSYSSQHAGRSHGRERGAAESSTRPCATARSG